MVPKPKAERGRTLGARSPAQFDSVACNATRFAEGKAKEPVLRVHNDYTYRSAPKRVRDLLGDEADELLRHRFAIVNVWRPIRGPVLDSLLGAVRCRQLYRCRSGSERSRLSRSGRRDHVGAVQPDAHRWYYFSRCSWTRRCRSSATIPATDGRARLSFHTAFKDPTACHM